MNFTLFLRRHGLPGCLGLVLLPGWAGGPEGRAQSAVQAEGPPPAAAAYRVPNDWRELMQLNEEMRRFFERRVSRVGTAEERLDAIVAAILDKDGLNFHYSEEGNFDARETFRRRQGNCVAFSILVVAVAREYKLAARFNEIRTAPRWDRIGQVVAEFRHLNVVVRGDRGRVMVDLLPLPRAGVMENTARPVADARAFAMFYSNNGVYLLGQGRAAEALPLLQYATSIAPTYASGWVNLGHAHSVVGDKEQARVCYERALQEDGDEMKALVSLAQLYRNAGELGRAQEYERRTERFRERNPYYLAELARRDLVAGDATAADRRLRRALAIKDDAPEFYELAIEAARRLDRTKDRQRWAARLAELRAKQRTVEPLRPGR